MGPGVPSAGRWLREARHSTYLMGAKSSKREGEQAEQRRRLSIEVASSGSLLTTICARFGWRWRILRPRPSNLFTSMFRWWFRVYRLVFCDDILSDTSHLLGPPQCFPASQSRVVFCLPSGRSLRTLAPECQRLGLFNFQIFCRSSVPSRTSFTSFGFCSSLCLVPIISSNGVYRHCRNQW